MQAERRPHARLMVDEATAGELLDPPLPDLRQRRREHADVECGQQGGGAQQIAVGLVEVPHGAQDQLRERQSEQVRLGFLAARRNLLEQARRQLQVVRRPVSPFDDPAAYLRWYRGLLVMG